jgi:replicative DNA helicase
MSSQELSDRFTSIRSGVPHRDIRAWQWLSAEQRRNVDVARHSLKGQQLYAARGLRTLDSIVAEIRRMRAVHGLTAAFIDYIQLIQVPGIREKEQQMAVAADTLLSVAIDLQVAIVINSQVNKDRNNRTDKRMSMEDLKYAAAIGDSTRVGVLFQRPHEDDKSNESFRPCETKVQLEKNNEGLTGDFLLHFNPRIQTFEEGDCHIGCPYFGGTTKPEEPPQRGIFA